MELKHTLILCSFFLGIIILLYIRSYDLHEKESFFKMLLVTLFGGIASIVITTLLYSFIGKLGIPVQKNAFSAFFVIGPVEEASKFIAFLIIYFFIRKDLNEPTDGILYMSCVALGFSLIENYFYATKSVGSEHLLFLRIFISTPGHIFFSLFMGLAFYAFVKQKASASILFIPYLYACIMHGIFNSILFHGMAIFFLILFMQISQKYIISLLSYTTSKSPFLPTIKEFINKNEGKTKNGIVCLNCKSKNKKRTFEIKKISIQKCDNCEAYLTDIKSLYHIFHHFGADFRNLTNLFKHSTVFNTEYSVLYKGNYVSEKDGIAYFFLEEIEEAIDEYIKKFQNEIEQEWWFPDALAKLPV